MGFKARKRTKIVKNSCVTNLILCSARALRINFEARNEIHIFRYVRQLFSTIFERARFKAQLCSARARIIVFEAGNECAIVEIAIYQKSRFTKLEI